WIDDLQVYPQISPKGIRVTGRIARLASAALPERIALSTGGSTKSLEVRADGTFSGEYPLSEDAPLWDEFTPALQRLEARLDNGETKSITFGLREIRHDG